MLHCLQVAVLLTSTPFYRAASAGRRLNRAAPVLAAAAATRTSFVGGHARGQLGTAVRRATTTTKPKSTREMTKKRAAQKKSGDGGEAPTIAHAPDEVIPAGFDQTRTKLLTQTVMPREKKTDMENPCIVYWMMRDCRTVDNHALLFAQGLATKYQVPLRVVFTLPPPPSSAPGEGADGSPPKPEDMSLTLRHGDFLLDGLKVVAEELEAANVPLDVLQPACRTAVGTETIRYCINRNDALALVCDMSPLRQPRDWIETQTVPHLGQQVPVYQVDAHNIVPVWRASPKREVGARTLRPKINNVFAKYCTQFAEFAGNAHLAAEKVDAENQHDWEQYRRYLRLDESIEPVVGYVAGHEAAMERFREFCSTKLKNFDSMRNDPNQDVCSNLSPWINHGQVSFQRLALEVRALKKHTNGTAAYIEEGVVRRELSDNFVYYTPSSYDSLEGAADWARDSLQLHSTDKREYVYTWKVLETGMTHDDLWNAAQLQLVREGKMHGFLRMYWAKKVLEWTVSPAYALATAQYFNDRYALDGNDPNGFVGVGWSIMGIHDMGWKERDVFGKIRFMNYAGCRRKFKVDTFVARYRGAKENANKVAPAGEKVAGKKRKSV